MPLATAERPLRPTAAPSRCRVGGSGRDRRQRAVLGDHLDQLVERHRPVHQVALGERRVHVLAQVVELAGPLDALDDHVEARAPGPSS